MATKTDYLFRIEPQDVDFTQRAKISSIMTMILNTAGLDADSKNFGIEYLNKNNHSWVLSRMSLEIDFRPPQYSMCKISTWVNEYERLLSTRNFTLELENGDSFARAVTQWAIIDLNSRTAINLSQHGLSENGTLVNEPSPTTKAIRIGNITPTKTKKYEVVYSDIDFNKHANTVSYIKIALDMLPIAFFENENKIRLDMHFIRECHLGEILSINSDIRNNQAHFEIQREDNSVAFRAFLNISY